MRVVVGIKLHRRISNRLRPWDAETLGAVRQKAAKVLPITDPDGWSWHSWVTPDQTGLLLVATNEPSAHETILRVASGGEGAHAICGYLSSPPPGDSFEQLADRGEGNFATVGVGHELTAYRPTPGVEPLFYGHTRQMTVVSSRAAVVAALLAGCPARLSYDLALIPEFLSAGFPVSDRTPFRNVSSLPADLLLASNARGRLRLQPFGRRQAGSASPEEVANSLVAALSPLRHASSVELGLTGGKDSRLVAAALHAAGIPFTTRTHGHPDHPDVVVAKQVAETLGVAHHNAVPPHKRPDRHSPVLEIRLISRLHHAVRVSEGMVSAYENLSSSDSFDPRLRLSGQGGELLRGGYGHYLSTLEEGSATAFLTSGFCRYRALLLPDAARDYDKLLRPWLERATSHPLDTLDEFYLRYRAGRWSASARSAYTLGQNLLQPFFDSRLVRTAHRTSVRQRVEERLIHDVLSCLTPELKRVPFAVRRWRFEELYGPATNSPTPVPESRRPVAAFNWRREYGSDLQRALAEVILDPGRDQDLYQVVRRDAVERLVFATPPTSQHVVWHLATVAYLLSSAWIGPKPVAAPIVTVPLPSS